MSCLYCVICYCFKKLREKLNGLDGWMDGWMDGRARLRIAYSNQKLKTFFFLAAPS